MWGSSRNSSQRPGKQKQEREGFSVSFRLENFIPGLVVGFICGMLLDLSKPTKSGTSKSNLSAGKSQQLDFFSRNGVQELKMVLVVRQDLKMRSGKIASQCAHAATGMYAELMRSCKQSPIDFIDMLVITCLELSNNPELLQRPVPSETMGTMWSTQNSCYM
ncbi:peptidyl-tRNA hydrolase 2, mitochondrial isoform X5 [Carica papaya]|uniref:peptidyl-tRNA hydrolase 2, mitochondrial isoform X5 n=1 Tax=Carica papaya TaxID=3649 RepID=UPI000B8C9D2C|nr:peptidyl-tRNA hydrolase 2, mitochondrial isoform X5 [Carica papaya]